MGDNPSHFKACGDDCPVERVSWDDAQLFIKKLNQLTGKKYRLPTEAEWEYAARSGGRFERFAGGDNADALAWYGANSGRTTHPVGQKKPNGLGLYDMSGNVWQWVSDKWYDTDARTGTRVIRGGSWNDPPEDVQAALRGLHAASGTRSNRIGFRLVEASKQ
jgi:formylglycine-generating enzyme required for sulfatase activity